MKTELLHPKTGLPIRPLGYRKDGRPIMPILGGDGSDANAMTYKQVCNRLEDIRDDLQRINAREDKEGGLLPEDQQRFVDLTDEFDELLDRKGRLERDAAMLKVRQAKVGRVAESHRGAGRIERGADDMDADPLGEPDSIEQRRFRNPWDTSEIRLGLTPQARATELRARALSCIEKMQGTTDRRREAATKIIEEFDSSDARISQMVLATSSPEYLRAFGKLARSQGQMGVLNEEERNAVERAMSLTDADGGYLVPFQLDPTVILTSDGSLNEIRQIARKVVATGDVWNGVSAGAVSWSFDNEAEEVSDDSPTFGQPTISIKKAQGFVPISLEAAMDENNVAQEVGRLLAQGRDDLEAQVFIDGDNATKEPNGIVTALVAAGGSSVVASAASDTFATGDLYTVKNSLAARYRNRAAWLATSDFYDLVRQADDALFDNIANATAPTLLGKRTYEAEAMDGSVTATEDNYLAVFGDFSNYVIADRIGMTVEFIPHLFGAAGRPKGQRGWFAYYRVGADVVNAAGLRLYNVT